jgi:hypothetical protein
LFGFLLFMKNRKLKGIILALSFLLIFFCEISWSTDITVTGSGWSENIDALNLLAGAGSNLIDTYQSAADAVQLNITATGNWKVQVEKTDSTLPGGLHLYIRKTSTPEGSYQEVTDIDQDFLGVSGTGNTNVNVQFKLTGVSIQVLPPGSYSATIQYTVFDQ